MSRVKRNNVSSNVTWRSNKDRKKDIGAKLVRTNKVSSRVQNPWLAIRLNWPVTILEYVIMLYFES